MATKEPPTYAPAILLSQLEDPDLVEFCDDCVKYLRGMKVAFLSKYRDRFAGGTALDILPSRDYVLDLFQRALRRSQPQTQLDAFKQIVSELAKEGEPPVPDSLAQIVFARRQEIAACLTQMVFRQGAETVLLDYNYNIETVLASDSFSKVNECILTLELILKHQENGEGEEKLRRVVLELNKDETVNFVH